MIVRRVKVIKAGKYCGTIEAVNVNGNFVILIITLADGRVLSCSLNVDTDFEKLSVLLDEENAEEIDETQLIGLEVQVKVSEYKAKNGNTYLRVEHLKSVETETDDNEEEDLEIPDNVEIADDEDVDTPYSRPARKRRNM